MEVDLLVEREGRYFYADPVFRYWVAQTTKGIAIEGFPRQVELKALVAGLAERFARASTQLGEPKRAKYESYFENWRGGRCPESLGQAVPIRIPAFKRVEPYRSTDGLTEIDALSRKRRTVGG